MKKLILTVLVVAIISSLAACVQPVSEVEEIEVLNLDTSDFVEGGDDVNISDVDVKVTFADGTSQTLGIDEVDVTGSSGAFVSEEEYVLDMSDAGEYTLTISYGGVTVNINYVVAVAALVADTSWYDGQSSSYTISSAEELAGLAEIVNRETDPDDFDGETITLDDNIDLADAPWTPIGTAHGDPGSAGTIDSSFKGTFDGDAHTI
ncbi:MAG: bacterial Ig-like domain-containing protein [Acholeplasmataceae bacterium]